MSGESAPFNNRIDASLARGYARMALVEAERRAATIRATPPARSLANEVARRRHLDRRIAALGDAAIGAVASSGCRSAAVAFLNVGRLTPRWPGIAILGETVAFDLRRSRPAGALPSPRGAPVVDLQVDAFLDLHALKRLSQRLGRRTLDDYVDTVRPLFGWLRVARIAGVMGTFQIPMEEGILCCERRRHPQTVCPGAGGAPITRIVTYLQLETATDAVQQRWRRLAASGALLHRPRHPRLGPPTEAELAAMEVMRREGAEWEARRDMASDLRRGALRTEPPETDGSVSACA
jgi:hypothetical protein